MARRRPLPALLLSFLLFAQPGMPASAPELPALDEAQLVWLGERIFSNECAGRLSCLTAWNAGENFPSLGIGHFIWYQHGQKEAFTESFPALLDYLGARGAPPPAWIEATDREAPWPDREAFLADIDSPRMRELRGYLEDTMALQTAFIVRRLREAPDLLLQAAEPGDRRAIARRFQAVANASPPHGLFALIDYTHFKGEGTAPAERYRGRGWGLLQVLSNMRDGGDPLAAFAASAREILAERVRNAPPERGEERWLQGWHKRVDGYPPTPAGQDIDRGMP